MKKKKDSTISIDRLKNSIIVNPNPPQTYDVWYTPPDSYTEINRPYVSVASYSSSNPPTTIMLPQGTPLYADDGHQYPSRAAYDRMVVVLDHKMEIGNIRSHGMLHSTAGFYKVYHDAFSPHEVWVNGNDLFSISTNSIWDGTYTMKSYTETPISKAEDKFRTDIPIIHIPKKDFNDYRGEIMDLALKYKYTLLRDPDNEKHSYKVFEKMG